MKQYTGITEDMASVTLHTAGSGSLLVNGLPVQDAGSGITCQYPAGTVITVTAVPDSGSVLAGWSGAAAGTEKTVSIPVSGSMNLTAKFQEGVRGDVNADGICSTADAVLLQKWLLSVPNTVLPDWNAGDLNNDKKLDAADLTLLKQLL